MCDVLNHHRYNKEKKIKPLLSVKVNKKNSVFNFNFLKKMMARRLTMEEPQIKQTIGTIT